ncbi:MAG: hypothetical protein IIC22_04065 [Chloroflexi bacterium]|nr:hypothetical protein [Chloroflexota bacterium]
MPLKTYETPDNLIARLDGVVGAAARTEFYPRFLDGRSGVNSLEEFQGIPITPLETYQRQRLGEIVADNSKVEWIIGSHRGQSPEFVATTEGPEEAATRYELFTDAVKQCLSLDKPLTCAIVASGAQRFFAAEIGGILIRAGVPTHVFVDKNRERTYEMLRHVSPEILVNLSSRLDEEKLPGGIELCITFRRSQQMRKISQLDFYHVDELGFLGQSTDCESYLLNSDEYYFERSDNGRLIVTSLYNHVQPMLRIETMDTVKPLGKHGVEFNQMRINT